MKKTIGALVPKKNRHELGSNLIAIAVLTLAIGFLAIGAIYLMQNYELIHSDQQSIDNLRDVETALNDFVAREGRYPCPAPLNLAPDTTAPDGTEFGKEGAGACTGTVHDGTYRAVGRAGATVRIGAVPVRSLHISDDKMMDGYGKRYFYAITESLATAGTDVRNDLGAITINNQNGDSISDAPGHIVYALISPGSDNRGAFNEEGELILPCETGTLAGNNCDFVSNPSPTATFISSTEKSFDTGSDSFTYSFSFKANSVPYHWNSGPWDECAGYCYEGTQNRIVHCEDHRGGVVADSFCAHSPKPEITRQCGLGPCTWYIVNWEINGGWSPMCYASDSPLINPDGSPKSDVFNGGR